MINVKNDEQLVKLATIVQRMATAGSKDEDGDFILSDKEKEQLMNNIEQTVTEMQDHSDKITAKIDN